MAIEQTLCIVKPDAVEKGKTGVILARIEEEGFCIVELRKLQLTRQEAEEFYQVHESQHFFRELIDFMTRSPVVVAVLQRENAVAFYRTLMGVTDPAKAEGRTLRKLFGSSLGENAVHGSDSAESAVREIRFFFERWHQLSSSL